VVVDFVKHITGKNMLLHLEMANCSSKLLPQSVTRVGHDGKKLKEIHNIDQTVADDLDPWHFKKLEMAHFVEYCCERRAWISFDAFMQME